jgi:hypothetical protein
LTHVPPPGLQVVRSFGLFATAARPTLAACRARLEGREEPAAEPTTPLPAPLPQRAGPGLPPGLRPRTCPVGGRALVVRETFGPAASGLPPEFRRAA